MQLLGCDLRGGLFRSLYAGHNPAGFWTSLGVTGLLLILSVGLQLGFSLLAQRVLNGSSPFSLETAMQGVLFGVFPAAVLTTLAALWLSRLRGGTAAGVLNLRAPRLGVFGWPLVVLGFFLTLALLFNTLLSILRSYGIQESPQGAVEDAMKTLASNPTLYLLVLPSVVIGAPLWEETLFRGQFFTALAQSRLGKVGASLITSAVWASLHYHGGFLQVGLIFIMGLVLSAILIRFGSLWVTMACHAAWNSVSAFVLYNISSLT